MTNTFTNSLREEERAYNDEADRPLRSYLRVLGVYAGALAALPAIVRSTGTRAPERIAPLDLLLMGLSTHRISRTITKNPVTSPLRAPFTRYAGVSGPAELREEVRGHGVEHAVGELLIAGTPKTGDRPGGRLARRLFFAWPLSSCYSSIDRTRQLVDSQ